MELVFNASAECSELLARYCYVESYFFQNRGPEKGIEELEKAIIGAYTAILNYSAAVKQALDGSALSELCNMPT